MNDSTAMTLSVSIRPLAEGDARISWRWRNDPEIWKLTGRRPDREITYEIERDWIKKVLQEQDSRRFAIIAHHDEAEKYIGNIQLVKITGTTGERHTFIGERDYWGRGVATAAGRLVLAFAFYELKLQSVLARIRMENKSMIRACEKQGFRAVGQESRTSASGETTTWSVMEGTRESCAPFLPPPATRSIEIS